MTASRNPKLTSPQSHLCPNTSHAHNAGAHSAPQRPPSPLKPRLRKSNTLLPPTLKPVHLSHPPHPRLLRQPRKGGTKLFKPINPTTTPAPRSPHRRDDCSATPFPSLNFKAEEKPRGNQLTTPKLPPIHRRYHVPYGKRIARIDRHSRITLLPLDCLPHTCAPQQLQATRNVTKP